MTRQGPRTVAFSGHNCSSPVTSWMWSETTESCTRADGKESLIAWAMETMLKKPLSSIALRNSAFRGVSSPGVRHQRWPMKRGSIQLREPLSHSNREHLMPALAEGIGHGLADAAIVYEQQPARTFDVTQRGRWSCPSPRWTIEPLRRISFFLEPVRRELECAVR